LPLEDAPKGYAEFNKGVAAKYVLDPHGLLPKVA
jgi:glutathione-independent formaldehyde dehydrogenase